MSEWLLNIKFVSEVKKHPCLYNYNLKEYTNKEEREKAWIAVGNAVNLTVQEAKIKWKNIRTVFARNFKHPVSGSLKKRRYYLTNAMQFAIPYIKAFRDLSCSSPNSYNETIQAFELQDDEETQAFTSTPTLPPPSASPPPTTSPTASSSHQTEHITTPLSVSSRRSSSVCSNNNKASENDELFNEYLKRKMSKLNDVNDESTNNANKMFLLSLLPDLNCMTATQIRLFKRQVLDVIDNILIVPSTSSTQTSASVPVPNNLSTLSS